MKQSSEELAILCRISGAISHSLRSPLSVILSLLKDAQAGYALSEEDLDDGVRAAGYVLEIAEILRDAAYLMQNSAESITLGEVLSDCSERYRRGAEQCSVEVVPTCSSYKLDKAPFLHALHCCISYFRRSGLTQGSSRVIILLRRGEEGVAEHLSIQVQGCDPRLVERLQSAASLTAFVDAEHSIESILLRHALLSFASQGILVSVHIHEPNAVELRMRVS